MRNISVVVSLVTLLISSISVYAECERKELRSPSLETLIEACKCGHRDVVKQHIEAGINLNDYDTEYWTPLKTALANGNKEIADLLIENGADVNMKADYDETILFGAVRGSGIKAVKYLISKGADINARNRDGQTPLFVLKYGGRIVIAELLIEAGANVNARDKNGISVLSHYLKKSDDEVIQLLKSYGARE